MATTSGTQPSAPKPGLGDLEKELVCSICTELLYQPLTLLDCLHTFCGSCLKEWFSWQAIRSRSSGSASRFTCPACRAAVRATRPNATVTTLLDMVLVANPERDRTAEEKEEIAKKYKPGDQVLASPGSSDAESDGDGRLVADGANSHRRRASASHSGDGRRQRSADNRDHHHRHHNVARDAARTGAAVGNNNESMRRIEHQSSLRSLLSASDVEDNTQEEIVRLIMEEGMLDGINLSGLDQSQEEELSDRLVQIFLSRHPDRSRQPRRSSDQTERTIPPEHRRSRSQTLQSQTQNSTSTENTSRRPPVSRPHLLGVSLDPHNHRRRASDETRRRRTSPTPVAPASTSETALRPALRSSSDISSQRPRVSPSRPRTRDSSTASVTRRSTEPEGRASDVWAGMNGSQQNVTSREVVGSPLTNSPSTTMPTEHIFPASTTSLPGISASDAQSPSSNVQSSSRRNTATRSGPVRQTANRVPSTHYAEPSISCERCGKTDIQYELHKRCLKCKDGNYHVCLHCYRVDRGCPHYYGVGSIGEMNFNKAHHPALRSNVEMPHAMKSQRYRRPKEGSSRGTTDGKQMTNDNPSSRLQEGMFCDVCHSTANGCFWQCDECNESEWGYCRRCVNQGRCCNHPLLPIRRISSESPTPSPTVTPLGPITPPVSTQKALPEAATYQVLSFSTECDICKYPIAPSSTRFHCLQCNEGDYDVCTNCYLKLVVSGKISKENGHSGWRRCLKGHRMIVIGYEDHERGQRRVIVRDIVGGYTLKDEQVNPQPPSSSSGSIASPELGTGDWSWKEGNTKRKKAGRARISHVNALDSSSPSSPSTQTATSTSTTSPPDRRTATTIPPDGGYGLVLGANWSYFAEESCTDELSFPRGAEITEAENINDEWYWGYYAGRTGLFPGAYCSLVREVV